MSPSTSRRRDYRKHSGNYRPSEGRQSSQRVRPSWKTCVASSVKASVGGRGIFFVLNPPFKVLTGALKGAASLYLGRRFKAIHTPFVGCTFVSISSWYPSWRYLTNCGDISQGKDDCVFTPLQFTSEVAP